MTYIVYANHLKIWLNRPVHTKEKFDKNNDLFL